MSESATTVYFLFCPSCDRHSSHSLIYSLEDPFYLLLMNGASSFACLLAPALLNLALQSAVAADPSEKRTDEQRAAKPQCRRDGAARRGRDGRRL